MIASPDRRTPRVRPEELSERDLAVVASVAEHRFLTAGHVEQLHFTDHASSHSGSRVCRRVLARLFHERLVARLDRRVGGVRAGSASYIYALGSEGGRLLTGERHRVTEPSLRFLAHTLAIADVHVDLVTAERRGLLRLASVEVEPACWRRFIGLGGAREIVRPDLYVVTRSGDFEDCWFVEVDRGTESPAALARKCRAYEIYRRSGHEQRSRGTFPLVVWMAPDDRRVRRIERVMATGRGINCELFRVCTAEDLVRLLAGGAQ